MRTTLTAALCSVLFFTNPASATAQTIDEMQQKGLQFLEVTQAADGSWTNSNAVGITGLVTTSLLMSGKGVDDAVVKKGLDCIVSKQQATGGIHTAESRHQNYETCIAILALSEANADGRFNEVIKKAENFLRGLQWDEGEGIETTDGAFGGGGYDSKQRPDMSNTQFLIEALKKAGVANDDPAMQRALIFVSRAQNLESQHNQLPYAGKVNDGGFIYTPAKGGESKAGTTENGGHKSYGSITYAGLKSMIYAGLTKDDQRVKAATAWLKKHYTLDENPNMGQQGLYYYYQTMAKTMSALGEEEFEDDKGTKHLWKQELSGKLATLQQKNGSWLNEADRWYEGDPNLVTAYCLIALAHCEEPAATTADIEPPAGMKLVYEHNFEDKATDLYEPTDKSAWSLLEQNGNQVIALTKRNSDFKPPFRSPLNRNLIRDLKVSSFVMDIRFQSTIPTYDHQSLCLFFGYQDDSHLYYVHFGKKADDHANQIFIVNNEARRKISTKTTAGTPWTDGWHRARIVRNADSGEITVYFDDLKTPVMTATDKTFGEGRVGFGSFDDIGNFDDVRIYVPE